MKIEESIVAGLQVQRGELLIQYTDSANWLQLPGFDVSIVRGNVYVMICNIVTCISRSLFIKFIILYILIILFYIIVFPFPSESLNIELKVESLKFKVEF